MSYRCLICKEDIQYNFWDIIQCHNGCCRFDFKDEGGNILTLSQRTINRYDYTQLINNREYVICGMNDPDALLDEPPFTNIWYEDKMILILPYQQISNQKEYQELAPRLLKMKAFV